MPVRVAVPSLRDSDQYFSLPSTPPAAACWAKLFRPAKRDWGGGGSGIGRPLKALSNREEQ